MDNLEDKINSLFSSPESLAQIKKLAEALSGSGSGTQQTGPVPDNAPAATASPSVPALDPKMMQLFAAVMREYSAPSEAATLINALRPYLKADRLTKVDKALSIAKLAKAAKVILPEIGGGKIV